MTQWNFVSFSTASVGQPKGPVMLAFHMFGVCEHVHMQVCTSVCAHTCVCAGCGVGEAREIAALPHWTATHCPSHSLTSQKTTRSWNTAGTESEASPESHMRWLSMLFARYYEACWVAQWASEITSLKGSYQQTAKRRNIFFFPAWTTRLVGS